MAATGELRALIASALGDQERVAAAYVFGSVGRGEASPLSDVDVALVLDQRYGALERAVAVREALVALGRSVPGTEFDVHVLEELPAAIAGRAVTEGELVFERDAAARVRAEVAALMAFHDFAWLEQATLEEGLEGIRRRLGDG
jgi:predicted nucleotidyltransferase